MSVADGPVRSREAAGASPATLTSFHSASYGSASHFWKAGRYKLAAPVSKTGSVRTEVGALPTPSATSTIKPGEPIMTTIVQFVPKWLRLRLQKPAQPKSRTVSKKDRQVLPTLSNQTRSVIFSQDDSPAGYRVLWRL